MAELRMNDLLYSNENKLDIVCKQIGNENNSIVKSVAM